MIWLIYFCRNGKKVTEEENKLFMSIFKIVMEGGESVEEHFYIGEDGDTMNYRMKVWQNVLRSYTQLVSLGTSFTPLSTKCNNS